MSECPAATIISQEAMGSGWNCPGAKSVWGVDMARDLRPLQAAGAERRRLPESLIAEVMEARHG